MNRTAARERTALVLYVVLLVLPSVVFGGLLAHRAWRDHQRELASVPYRCEDAARRLVDGVALRLEERLEEEGSRPFFHFQDHYLDPDTTGDVALTPSPLRAKPRPEGVLAWYSYDDYAGAGVEETVQTFLGADPGIDEQELRRFVVEDIAKDSTESVTRRRVITEAAMTDDDVEGEYESVDYSLRVLGVNLHRGSRDECRDIPRQAGQVLEDRASVRVSPLRLRLMHDSKGELRLVAERVFYFKGYPLLPTAPPCITHISRMHYAWQGVLLDPVWLFDELPRREAQQVLDPTQRLLPSSEVDPSDAHNVSACGANLFDLTPVGVSSADDYALGELRIATDLSGIRQGFRAQLAWLAGVASVLAISMGVGVRLLIGRIRSSAEEALRTQNLVASVTHELRTPISAVKLYGEMLADGWIHDEARKQEYLERIVRETDRLSMLVDRVLLRRRLQDQPPDPQPGDLNSEVLAQRAELGLVGGETADDLEFDLAPDLPEVLLVPDGIHVVLANLVENARKYAPVAPRRNGSASRAHEPILIRTRRDRRGQVTLEVLDRGPGVPVAERRRIFEAFYRCGDEHTRETTGTGLGLHLVALQARAMRGKVEVLPREGGGSRFVLTLNCSRGPRARGNGPGSAP